MPFLPAILAIALLLSGCAAQRNEVPTRRLIGDKVWIGVLHQRSATQIPAACKPQTKCPTETGLFTCGVYTGGDCASFCSRTLTPYLALLARCGKSPSSLGRYLLSSSCKTQCEAARREALKGSPISENEKKKLRQASCDAGCQARIWAQARERRPHALVVAAQRGASYRPGFKLFAPWLWDTRPCVKVYGGNPLKFENNVCAPILDRSCWYCAQFRTSCPTTCSTCWGFSLDCEIPY